MSALKTTPTGNSVAAFLDGIPAQEKRQDAYQLMALMEAVTCSKGRMWGAGIVEFGDTLLSYESGQKLNWFIMGFSPRKQNFALYIPKRRSHWYPWGMTGFHLPRPVSSSNSNPGSIR